jgi:AcrR family transcriptional regulator
VKQERARRTYESVLDAAAREFARHGFTAANLSAVVSRTGLTKGALYGHFPSKAALAGELDRRFRASWDAVLATSCSGPPEREARDVVIAVAGRLDHDIRFQAGFRLAWDAAREEDRRPVFLDDLVDRIEKTVQPSAGTGPRHRVPEPRVSARLAVAVLCGAWVMTAPGCPDGSGALPRTVAELFGAALPEVPEFGDPPP